MGEHHVNKTTDQVNRSLFTRHLLDDIKALEIMLDQHMIEDDITRIGAEQEFCLITDHWRPTCNGGELLKAIDHPNFTSELANFNLEINLDPFEFKSDCFTKVQNQLESLLKHAKTVAKTFDTGIVLVGILPTISKDELTMKFMTNNPRYYALNEVIKKMRGSDFQLHIRGVDELSITHNSVLFEACNTSFQMHLQIPSYDFISSYNWAQAISGPVLGVSTNSPLLLGRELWSETRIALFRQSIDLRSSSYALKDQSSRVTFGDCWAEGNIAEMYKNEIARYKIILSREMEENSLEQLKKGNVPKLNALSLHNGTIYRWNRACYGVGNGKPHLRIENRYIPSGPTIIDEMANFAFWTGLMYGRPAKFDDMPSQMNFNDAKSNFLKASRYGRESVMHWEGRLISVRDLVEKELLPMAYSGLNKAGIDKDDIERLLTIIEKRNKGNTGSQWQRQNFRLLRKTMKKDDALRAITKAMQHYQAKNIPVHEWPMLESKIDTYQGSVYVGHIMSTQLFTVNENDLAELATSVMLWKNVHHMPVESNSGNLVGVITWKRMERFIKEKGSKENYCVRDIMVSNVITVKPTTLISEAIQIMKKNEIGSLPVVQDQHLVGIITIKDVLEFDHA